MLSSDQAVFLLRGDGALDPKRHGGRVTLPAGVFQVSVDPATGRFAVLRQTAANDGRVDDFTVDAYDAKGKRLDSRQLDADFAGRLPSVVGFGVAIAPDGAVTVALSTTSLDVPDAGVELRRYDAALRPDAGYGTGGVARATLYVGPTNGNNLRVDGLKLDATGRAYVAFRTGTSGEDQGVVESKLLRLAASGAVDASYGTAGVATLFSYERPDYPEEGYEGFTTWTTLFVMGESLRVADDGRAYLLTHDTLAPGDGAQATYFQYHLVRLGADGRARAESTVGRETTFGSRGDRAAALALGADGVVYAALNAFGPTASIFKFVDDGSGVLADPSWSSFGAFAVTSATVSANGAAVDRAGRLLISSGRVLAFAGSAEVPAERASNGVFRLPDGTVLINGTSEADRIELGTKRGRYRVTLHGRVTELGADEPAGIVVRAGNGDDVVYLGTSVASAYVEAGAGDDVVTSTSARLYGSVTLVGGSGDDALTGGGGGDYLYGQDGDDTLAGGGAQDELFGGRGDDRLYASIGSESIRDRHADYAGDRLSPGEGADFASVDNDLYEDQNTGGPGHVYYTRYAFDLVLSASGDDTIVGA